MQAAAKVLTILLAVMLTAGLPISSGTCLGEIVGCANESIAQSPSCCAASDCCCGMSAPKPRAPQPDDSAVSPSGKVALDAAIPLSSVASVMNISLAHAPGRVSVPAAIRDAPLYSLTHSFLI